MKCIEIVKYTHDRSARLAPNVLNVGFFGKRLVDHALLDLPAHQVLLAAQVRSKVSFVFFGHFKTLFAFSH